MNFSPSYNGTLNRDLLQILRSGAKGCFRAKQAGKVTLNEVLSHVEETLSGTPEVAEEWQWFLESFSRQELLEHWQSIFAPRVGHRMSRLPRPMGRAPLLDA